MQNSKCASALQQLGHYQYALEEKQASGKNSNIDHQKSIGYFLEYIDKYPKESKTPMVLYQTAALLEASGKDEKAYQLRKRLVEGFPDNGLVPKAWLRIAEYHFMNRKFRDAIGAYKKVTGFKNLTGKEATLAMYHLAESYYNIAEYETAAVKYYDYIIGADKGKYPNDLRAEALDFMALAFSKVEGDALQCARKFFKDKNVTFKEYVYSGIQNRLKMKPQKDPTKTVLEESSDNQDNEMDETETKSNQDDDAEEELKPVFGEMRDSRNGKIYRTVTIGEQTWMAENLNYQVAGSCCFEGKKSNCQEYGRLYTWQAAMNACPMGWHLPTENEFKTLLKSVGGYEPEGCLGSRCTVVLDDASAIRSSKWDNGTDTCGLSLLPAGVRTRSCIEGDCMVGGFTSLWSSSDSEHVNEEAFFLTVSFDAHISGYYKDDSYSVRCIMDSN